MQGQNIEFLNIRPTYLLTQSIPVCFQTLLLSGIKPGWEMKVGDCVAICKINSGSLSSCMSRKVLTREFFETFAHSNQFYVVFEQHELPTDMKCEYQFVYFSNGSIIASSKKFRFVLYETKQTLEEPLIQSRLNKLPLSKEYFFYAIENGLLKQNERLTTSLRLPEAECETPKVRLARGLTQSMPINSKSDVEKFMTEFKLNPLQYISTIEEILNENARLTKVLETTNQELVQLRDEVKDHKSLTGDLIKKLSTSERKVDTYDREKRSIESKIPKTPISSKLYSGLENGLKCLPIELPSELDLKLRRMFPILDEIRVNGKLPLNFNLLRFLESEFKQIYDKPGNNLKEDLLSLISELRELMSEKHDEIKPIVPETLYCTEVKRSLPLTTTKIDLSKSGIIPPDVPSILDYLPGILPVVPPTEDKKFLEELVAKILKGETLIPTSKPEVRSKIVESSTITKPIKREVSIKEEDITTRPSCPVCGIRKPKQTEIVHFIEHVNSHY